MTRRLAPILDLWPKPQPPTTGTGLGGLGGGSVEEAPEPPRYGRGLGSAGQNSSAPVTWAMGKTWREAAQIVSRVWTGVPSSP